MAYDDTTMSLTGPDGLSTGPIKMSDFKRAAERVQMEIPGAEAPSEDERIEGEDELFRELLTPDQRTWQDDARRHLEAEDAIFETARRSKMTRIKVPVIFRHSKEEMSCQATLSITFEARERQVGDVALSRYLASLATYEGLPSDVVDQVCHDLYCALRPKLIKVQLVAKIHGVQRTEEEERSWSWTLI
jgi:hypothetical protein